jgi:pimeloyl-ACP methyl ester carboxylesterase
VRELVVPGTRDGVRCLRAGPPAGVHRPHVVVVPGMGALGYLVPLLRELGRREVTATLLDLPGFGSTRRRQSGASVHGIGEATADVVRHLARVGELPDVSTVLVGHSTGAQAAARAAVAVQDDVSLAAVVLAGPTVAPTQRSLRRLLTAAPAAFLADSPRELRVVPDFVRGGRGTVDLLRSAVADRPERVVARLRAPLVITAGRLDAIAPRWWLDVLAGSAVRSRAVRVVTTPGSHNNPFTCPAEVADVVLACAPGV